MSELVWGIKNGDLDQVKDVIEKKEIDINKEIDGRSPIHYAADYGQHDVIQYLISKGADVNRWLVEGRAAYAYANGAVAQCLLIRGSHVYLTDSGEKQVGLKDKHGISALLAAIWEGHTSCVKLLLEHGASKDGTTPDGTSYLDAAEKEEIKLLLQK